MESCSYHANRRKAQRSVSSEYIDLVLVWGVEVRQPGGRAAFHLGRREAEAASTEGVFIPERAIGVAVVIAADGTIVTVVRSEDRQRLRAHGRHSPHRRPMGSRR